MIARIWSGICRPETIDAYLAHLRQQTFPGLDALPGHLGAFALRHDSADRIHVTVVTFWASEAVIARFAGADVEAAVVPPEAQALLASWDARAVHWEVVDKPAGFAHK